MWTENEDLAILSDLYQIKIKIITINSLSTSFLRIKKDGVIEFYNQGHEERKGSFAPKFSDFHFRIRLCRKKTVCIFKLGRWGMVQYLFLRLQSLRIY